MIDINQIEKSYKKNKVLKGVTFSVKKQEIKALIGVNGSGKSTLVELICGVKKIDSGDIKINDISISDKKNKNELNRIIGYMPQSFCMFNDLTVYENLAYICSIYDLPLENIDKVLDACYLTEQKNTLSKNLSGGYKQLLSIATVIIHNPSVYILDEPTSAMDPLFRKKFWKIIKDCNKDGATILLITHYLEELLECDSFVLLSDGKIKFDGKVQDFKNKGFINIEEILSKYNLGNGNE